ncbi:hypothetical protein GALMADRAFT_143941 [Galerina marginata CBS 339.88]|uniref:Uncharacterized protein n=1 Tax=Galerina marginata (strain CBS 339.88) TaxID=685588 RepID=A0A067SJU6_GALM3|nr:hypothetical protein GALMADRAFT_143941 [Galerina marginata CBS 339.88]
MQFTLFTTALLACMTVIVSASPIPVPAPNAVVAREPATPIVVAREPQISPAICGSYQCI